MNDAAFQKCINPSCSATYSVTETKVACTKCGSLLDIKYDWSKLPVPKSLSYFEHRWATKGTEAEGRADFSGVLAVPRACCRSTAPSPTSSRSARSHALQDARLLAREMGMKPGNLLLQYEG
jgi:threonine synthase